MVLFPVSLNDLTTPNQTIFDTVYRFLYIHSELRYFKVGR